jgi:antitoxin (DNA-binding transcriptional repressor) of toxin-antitoxin stability system
MVMEMNVTEVRRRILALLEDLPEEGIIVTKRGEPMAKIVPIPAPRKGKYVTGPFIPDRGKPGTVSLTNEAIYDLIFD